MEEFAAQRRKLLEACFYPCILLAMGDWHAHPANDGRLAKWAVTTEKQEQQMIKPVYSDVVKVLA